MNAEFLQALKDLERERGLKTEVLLGVIEAALLSAYRRNFGTVQNARVEIDRNTGECRVLAQRTVVEEVEDPRTQISLEEARQIDPRYQPGDVVETEVTPRDFGRIAAQTAKQVVMQRIKEAERNMIYEAFAGREGDIVTGTVHRVDKQNIYVDLGKAEGVLPASEQIPGERYRQGDKIRAYLLEVRRTSKGPQIVLSRTHPGFLRRLLELEVPELQDGTVELKTMVREPGSRAKIAVYSRDPHVDPLGACVGPRGSRIQAVVNELRGEKIDVVRWDADSSRFIAEALSPAKVTAVEIWEEEKIARVIVPDNQLSLAIGREGQNARLAAKLTGWKIDIKSESQMAEIYSQEYAGYHGEEGGRGEES
ncbi:transcription termination factor NusA [Desulfothermobacter acidiphilus]|uniref:transcription termination factor NusA n=1 Tax=Desulfothermobacter acidiphilus TaxID=1938353 RepID=UPI003F8A0E44